MKLSARELMIVVFGGIAAVVLGFWLLLVDPLNEKIGRVQRRIVSVEDKHETIRRKAATFSHLTERIRTTEEALRRGEGFSVLSHLENQARTMGVKNKIVQMKPRPGQTTRFYKESVVEIKMEKVPLEQLVNYLYEVENSPQLLRLKETKIRPRFDNPNLMDAWITVSTYELVESS